MSIRRAAAWSVSGQYITFVVQFAASVIISRFFLAPTEVGLFSIAMAATMIVAMLQDMGVTRFISGQQQMQPEHIRDYTGLVVAMGWGVAALLMVAATPIARAYGLPELANVLRILAASYLLVPFSLVSAALLIRSMNFRALFKVNVSSAVVGNGVAITLAALEFGAASLAWGALATAAVRAVVAQLHQTALPRWPRSLAIVAPILRFGGSSSIISFSGAIGQRSQDLIVGGLLGVAATGLFTRASGLAGQLSMLTTGAVSSVFYPAFARKRDEGAPLAEPYLHLVACNTALTWAALGGMAIAAEPLILLLYGENWVGSAPLLQWFALAEILFVAIPLQMDVPLLLGRIKQLIWINLLDTVAAVSVLLIGCLFGLEAAAASRILYAMIWWTIYAVYQSHLLGFRLRSLLAIYARSGLCMIAACLPLYLVTRLAMPGEAVGVVMLLGLAGAGVLVWMASLVLTRHPAWGEIRLALTTLLGPLHARLIR